MNQSLPAREDVPFLFPGSSGVYDTTRTFSQRKNPPFSGCFPSRYQFQMAGTWEKTHSCNSACGNRGQIVTSTNPASGDPGYSTSFTRRINAEPTAPLL